MSNPAVAVQFMRLFTGIELPEVVGKPLARIVRRLESAAAMDLKYVRPENLHITLKFLGEVEGDRVTALSSGFEAIKEEPIGLLWADRAILLPARGSARVIAVGLAGDVAGVRQLVCSIEAHGEGPGFPDEKREFLAHITLARARTPLPRWSRQQLTDIISADLPGPQFTPTQFTLFKSDLKPGGPEYTALARYPLASR